MKIKAKLAAIDWKDLAKRAGKTFVQTFLSSLTIDGLLGISDKLGLQRWLLTTGLSALSMAISAVWNMAIGIVSDKAGEALDKIGEPAADTVLPTEAGREKLAELLDNYFSENEHFYSDDLADLIIKFSKDENAHNEKDPAEEQAEG